MNKIELLRFLVNYKNEIKSGNFTHTSDLIVVIVYSELSRNMSAIEKYNLTDISLSNLKLWNINCSILDLKEYTVPKKEELDLQVKQYKLQLKEKSLNSVGIVFEYTFATWLKLMLDFKMVEEGQIIDLTNYKLFDFITDEKLAKSFEGKPSTKSNVK